MYTRRVSYRDSRQQQTSAELAELSAYEAQLHRQTRRKKIVMWSVFGVLLTVGLGSCFGPIIGAIAEEEWRNRKVPLTSAEQKKVDDTLSTVEANAKKSQAAFAAIWPRIRDREIGARADLGRCNASVPGPDLRKKDQSRSLEESSGAYGWTFIDVTPAEARSPLATLKIPRGSLALNNSGYGDRFVLPPAPLRTAPSDRTPTLASMSLVDDVARLRAEAKALRAIDHKNYLERMNAFAADGMGIDVIVFVDFWADPKMTHEVAPPPPPPKDDLEAFTHPTPRPAMLFDPGFAVAHAVAWDPATQKVVCASQAVAMSSEHISYRSDQLEPLQQDLVLELERELGRSFVGVGDAPPKLEPPAFAIRALSGTPAPSSSASAPTTPMPSPTAAPSVRSPHDRRYGDTCRTSSECPSDALCSGGRCAQGPM